MPSRNCSILPNTGPFTARQVYDNLPLAQGSQYIRVLDVHKSDPADSDRLTGTLRTVDLRALPKFTALSYVWGQGSYHKIACNGCDINITQSCYEALTSLRESCQSLTVWVDAICINQEDTGEKEQQIMLMGRIYTLAEIVYVWLGVGNTKTDQAAEYIGAISQFRLFPAKVWPSSRTHTRRNLSRRLIEIGRYILPLAFRNLCIEPLITERYQKYTLLWIIHAMPYARLIYAERIDQLSSLPFVSQDVIHALLDQAWLSRAWTFQEMKLASNPVLVCGKQHILWLVMHQALTFIEHSATQALIDPVNSVISEIQRRGSKTRMYSLICHISIQPQNYLVALAQAIRDRNSKWPHDRVYAIDSVLRQLGAKPPAPDCQKPLGQVYRDALVGLMEWNPTLITLLVDCGSHLPDDPSWVPDWSQNNKSWVPDSYIYHGAEKRPWNEQDLAQSVSGNILSVEAACLGMSDYCLTLEESEVDELRSNQVTTNGKLVHNVQLLAEWVLRIRNDILIFRLHDSVPWTIMLTLTGRPILRSEITSEQEDTFRRMYEIITQLGIEADSVPEDTAAVATAATRALEAICQSEGCSKLFLDTCNRIAGRRGLIVSDNGLIGSGPISIRQGDTISLIKGIPVPMALRKVGEDYQVLGPVFIDGFMGLPTETSGSMNLDWETFRLV
ncbi:hypothetical protein CEK27_005096 [Fusarium fujikuroi]|nr:hypothetical protein CEK27_005096 [Fusarium fujikuroi]QGI78303.1 hypothetical protein CEK25_005032 [Fusarium fujikuroi]